MGEVDSGGGYEAVTKWGKLVELVRLMCFTGVIFDVLFGYVVFILYLC